MEHVGSVYKLVIANNAPESKNVMWYNPTARELRIFNNGEWEIMAIGSIEGLTELAEELHALEVVVQQIIEHGVPLGPDSVGSEEIKDNAILMRDLNEEVKNKIKHVYDEEEESLDIGD